MKVATNARCLRPCSHEKHDCNKVCLLGQQKRVTAHLQVIRCRMDLACLVDSRQVHGSHVFVTRQQLTSYTCTHTRTNTSTPQLENFHCTCISTPGDTLHTCKHIYTHADRQTDEMTKHLIEHLERPVQPDVERREFVLQRQQLVDAPFFHL